MSKFQRWGTQITNVHFDYFQFEKIDWTYYRNKLTEYEKKKIVYVVPVKRWSEEPLVDWFKENYSDFGFKEILHENSIEYEKLKEKMGFEGHPDFLVKENDKWKRLEVEVFSAQYKTHTKYFADILLCYDISAKLENIKVLTVKEFRNCKEIINLHEIPKFLLFYDSQFKKEYDRLLMKEYMKEIRKK